MAIAWRATLGSTWNTTTGSHTVTATPAVGDIILIFCGNTGITSNPTVSDNQGGTYSQINGALFNTSASKFFIYIRNQKVSSATSTIYTVTGASSTGGGLTVFAISGSLDPGLISVRQSAKQENQAAGTPAPVFGTAVITTHPVFGAIFNATNPATMTARANFTETTDVGFSSPVTGFEAMYRNSGETGTTMTWGSASGSVFASLVAELAPNGVTFTTTGAFTETGNNAVLGKGYKLFTATGSFSETGNNSILGKGYKLQTTIGAFVWIGNNAILTYAVSSNKYLYTTTGVFNLTGNNNIEKWTHNIFTSLGIFELSDDISAGMRVAHKTFTTAGSFTWTRNNSILLRAYKTFTSVGGFTWTGNNSIELWNHKNFITTGVFTWTGNDAILTKGGVAASYILQITTGSFTLSGNSIIELWKHLTFTTAGLFTLTGNSIIELWKHRLLVTVGDFVWTGWMVTLIYTGAVIPGCVTISDIQEASVILMDTIFTNSVVIIDMSVASVTIGDDDVC